jgi:hypothetical protein
MLCNKGIEPEDFSFKMACKQNRVQSGLDNLLSTNHLHQSLPVFPKQRSDGAGASTGASR